MQIAIVGVASFISSLAVEVWLLLLHLSIWFHINAQNVIQVYIFKREEKGVRRICRFITLGCVCVYYYCILMLMPVAAGRQRVGRLILDTLVLYVCVRVYRSLYWVYFKKIKKIPLPLSVSCNRKSLMLHLCRCTFVSFYPRSHIMVWLNRCLCHFGAVASTSIQVLIYSIVGNFIYLFNFLKKVYGDY